MMQLETVNLGLIKYVDSNGRWENQVERIWMEKMSLNLSAKARGS